MIRSFLLLSIGTILYANSDYIPFSEFSKNQEMKNNFIKIEENNNYKVKNFKQKTETKREVKLKERIKYAYINKPILEDTVKISTSISNFNSKSEQYIYSLNNGRKISQLTWRADNVKLFGLGLEYQIYDMEFFVNYKMNIKDGDGLMDDYDWLSDSSPDTWTDWSHHENTQVKDIRILDFGINKDFYINKTTKLKANFGYKWEKQLFEAYDGSYVYSSSDTLRDLEGNFSGIAITYNQEYKGFYFGGEFEKEYKDIKLLFNTKYTPWMEVEFTDTHHQRVPAFTDYTSFEKTSMFSLGAKADYNINSNQILSLSYDYTKYSKIKGDRVRSYVTNYNLSLPNTVGVESSNNLITLKYVYSFQAK